MLSLRRVAACVRSTIVVPSSTSGNTRNSSMNSNSCNSSDNQHVVTTTKRGDIILCWHPERQIPFEHTRPMTRDQQTIAMGDSPLMVKGALTESQSKYGPTYAELNEMFYVTKHEWRPRPKAKRAKTDTPKERNAL